MSSPSFSEPARPSEIHQVVPHSYLQKIVPFFPDTWMEWQQVSPQWPKAAQPNAKR